MTDITDDQFHQMMDRYQRTRPDNLQVGDQGFSVNAVNTIKLPAFWTEEPELWFAQIECSFSNHRPMITSDATKYSHVCEVLPPRVISTVKHIILSEVPEGEKYALLKAQLLKSFGQKSDQAGRTVGNGIQPNHGGQPPIGCPTHDKESFRAELQGRREGHLLEPPSNARQDCLGVLQGGHQRPACR